MIVKFDPTDQLVFKLGVEGEAGLAAALHVKQDLRHGQQQSWLEFGAFRHLAWIETCLHL